MATFITDTFSGTAAGTDLSGHTGELGATWVEHASFTSGAAVISNAERVRCTATPALYYASGTPAGVDYDVEAVLRFVTSSSNRRTGINGRVDTASDTRYRASYTVASARWELDKIVNGVVTNLGTWSESPSDGSDRTLKLEIRDAAKKLYVDGVERISSADNDITAAGVVAVSFIQTGTNTGGIHIDSINAVDASAAGTVDVSLSWDDTSTIEDGFKIERDDDGGGFVQIDTVAADVSTYEDNVPEGATYTWRVRSYNANGNSFYSNTDTVVVP